MLTAQKRKVLQNTPHCQEVRVWQGCYPKGKQPCPLSYLKITGSENVGINAGAAYTAQGFTGDPITVNKCYARFVDQVQESAMAAVNFAEREEAMKMVCQRAGQLVKAYRSFRKGRIVDGLKALGIKRTKGNRWAKPKDASKLWLEYHFGWAPLMQDIHTGVSIMTKDPTSKVVRASASRNTQWRGTLKDYQWVSSGGEHFTCHMSAEVSVESPNLFRANQLGLLNPAAIAWELVPFSFVVDWFTSVGQVINSLSDFIGLELKNAYTTVVYSGSTYLEYKQYEKPYPRGSSSGFRCIRTLGITGPSLALNEFKGLSLIRGATAIALVIGVFSHKLP